MKVQQKLKQGLGFFILSSILAVPYLSTEAQASRVEADLTYPVVIGTMAQNFSSNLGGSAAFYLEPLLDPRVNNFISVGYSSFTILADQRTSFRVIPVLVGLELPGRVFSDLQTTFSVAAGAAFAYLNIVNAASTKTWGYFSAQVKPGLAYEVGPDFSIYARTPVTFLVGSKTLSYIGYSIGAQLKL